MDSTVATSACEPVEHAAQARRTPSDPVEHLEAVYRDYPGLRAMILRRVRDPELAADILQDAAVTTLEKLRAGMVAHPAGVGGYLYRVALNHLRNYRRKDRGPLSSADALEEISDGDADRQSSEVDREQWARLARRTLEALPTVRDREILVRFYLLDEEKDDICKSLRLSTQHFNRVVFRARNRFRALLEEGGFVGLDMVATLALLMLAAGRGLGIA